MSDMIKLHDLTQTYNLSNSDLLHVNKNGRDYKLDFEWLVRNVESSIGIDEPKWNASHLEGIDVSITDIEPLDVLIFEKNANANSFVNRRLVYTDIDYSQLTESSTNRYLKIVNDQMITEEILITEVIPSSPNQRGKYLRVSDDGLNIVESDLNLSQFMVSPGSVISNMNTVPSGISTIGEVTMNKPKPEMEGYVISARSSSITTATAQIIIDYKSYDTYLRTHDGVSSSQNDYGEWYHIFNNKTHPLSNSISLDSATNIATSKAVNDNRIYLLDYIDSADDVLSTRINTKAPLTHTHPWSQVTGQPETATRWPTWNEVTGQPATATRWPTWNEVTGQPATATRWPTWNEVTGKPSTASPIPVGTKMLFQQTNAPTGWVKDTTHNNKALRVVTGTVGSGGSNAFSTAFGSGGGTTSSAGAHSHTVTVNNHTLTVSQMPRHDHSYEYRRKISGGDIGGNAHERTYSGSTGSMGDSGAHNHGASSNSTGAHTHTLNLNVQYVDLIIATKQ